jgi:hypothetical protein
MSSGSTAYHDGTKNLLVWNLVNGIDVYRLTDDHGGRAPRLTYVRPLRVQIRRNRIAQVQFDVDGTTAIAGGDNGQVLTWDLTTGKAAQTLPHGQGEFRFLQPSSILHPNTRTSCGPSHICEWLPSRCSASVNYPISTILHNPQNTLSPAARQNLVTRPPFSAFGHRR